MKRLVRTPLFFVLSILALSFSSSVAQNKFKASKTSIAFGSVVAAVSKVDSFSVKNDSSAVVNVSSITTNNGSIYALSGFTGGAINPAESVWVRITFTPAAVQSYPDTVKVNHDGAPNTATPLKVALSGSGTGQVTVSKASIPYGTLKLGLSKSDSFKVYNKFTSAISLSGITNNRAVFAITGNTTATIAAGDSVQITVNFTPDSVGVYADTLTVSHNGIGSPVKIPLSATTPNNLTLHNPTSPYAVRASISFGQTTSGIAKLDSLYVKNTAASMVNVTGLSFVNSDFSVKTTPTAFSLAAGDSIKIVVAYTGSGFGRDADSLLVTNDGSAKNSSPIKLPVSGFAVGSVFFRMSNFTLEQQHVIRPIQDTISIGDATTSSLGRLLPRIALDSIRLMAAATRNLGPGGVRIDSIKFAVGQYFFNVTPTPFNHQTGTAYDRLIRFQFNPSVVSASLKDTMIIFTNDTLPGANVLRQPVEGASQEIAYVRSATNTTSIAFGSVAVGAVGVSHIRVYNFSTLPLSIDSVKRKVGNSKFVLGIPSDSLLGRNDTSFIPVSFAPLDTLPTSVTQNDTVLVYYNDLATPSQIFVSGRPIVAITFSPSAATLNFGEVIPGFAKDTAIVIFNGTPNPIRVDSIAVKSGTNFTVTSNVLTHTISPGARDTVGIQFHPETVGSFRDTVRIFNNFKTGGTDTTVIVVIGNGTNQQVLDAANYLTVDNVPGIEGFAISSPDESYVETGAFWQNTTAGSFGGTHRRSPNLAGSPNGSSARFTFKIDSTGPYLVYHHNVNSANVGNGQYVQIRKFGIGGVYDSLRYDMKLNNATGFATSWYPLGVYWFDGVGPGAASVTIGSDALSSSFLRVDAVRLLRSTQQRDLEFGRRAGNFGPIRIPEEYPQITLTDTIRQSFRLYNLGRDTLTITNIQFYPTQTVVPWFYTENYAPGSILKIPPMTLNGSAQTGGYFDLVVGIQPFQEGTARDSMVIFSDDDAEPRAFNIFNGSGINYNFIMNASAGGTEPHFRAPIPPAVTTIPSYVENTNGTWLNSTAAGMPFPIVGGNASSRVNTGGTATLPHTATYEFEVPDLVFGTIPTDGNYIVEYTGPVGSANAHTNVRGIVTQSFGTPADTGYFNSRHTATVWVQIGGSTKTFFLSPGGPIQVKFERTATNDAGGLLRADLLRIRKVPTGALIGVGLVDNQGVVTGLPPGQPVGFGDIAFRNPAGLDGLANKKGVLVGSRGESQLLVKSISMKSGQFFRLASPAPVTPFYLRAINGDRNVKVEFIPDRIAASFRDTLVVETNSVQDSVLNIPLVGNGVGLTYFVDDGGLVEEISAIPTISGLYVGGWNPSKMNNWQTEQNAAANTIGYGTSRQWLPMYFNGNGRFEWYPLIPKGPSSDSIYLQVAALIQPGLSNASPAARYKVYSTGTNVATKDTLVSQNGRAGGGFAGLSEIPLGSHWFYRDGRDVFGGQAIFGHVRIENDTAAVSAIYGGGTNIAKRDTFGLIADAIILREVNAPPGSLVSVRDEKGVPISFALSQNYPNPFNPTTTINFDLPDRVPVDLRIYDLLGREVRVLINNEEVNPGFHKILWDGRSSSGQQVATGVYFYRIVAGGFVQSKKMLLIK